MEDYVKTGIPDFDNLLAKGGYPRGNQILVIGGPGSGKSIFCAQFIHAGAKFYGEPGVYVTLEALPEKLIKNMAAFGWDFRLMVGQGKVRFLDSSSFRPKMEKEMGEELYELDFMREDLDVDNMSDIIVQAIREISARRLVIDSISLLGLHTEDEFILRSKLLRLSEMLSRHGVTSLLVAEARTKDVGVEDYPVEMFMFDGVITLELDRDTKERKISINKMRGTKHVIGAFHFKITDLGVEITP
jgi:KaiC/GvpD/RAD55 family RecA-like ATPase